MTEREIFTAALNKADPAERVALLDEHCSGNAPLRQRIESLLAEHDQLGSFMDMPTSDATIDQHSPEKPGTIIGSYKLLEQIGEGGFGVVFMAEQTEPVRRKVALKILKPGMDTRQVIARFEAERQALAIMDHPNIAKVFDGGATALGRPYFVMELVKGVPITEFCDRNQLTPRQRLELFIPVCQAVQHAHQKGIVHRDLKPSNVLVTMHDTVPVVKVIDFGVAKALGQELTDKTLFTGFAQMIGSPLYMSPEQAGQSGLDIDTRSDIYALGVLLYELLTGTTPFSKEHFQTAAYDEIRRIIREEEPPKPSTRLAQSSATLPAVSTQRQTEPEKLTKILRGELDWIVMKALEKDRNRRYETANGLALDVQRYLADEPLEACPPSATYRFRKFARRNKTTLLTGSLVVAALLIGTVVSTWQAIRAERSLLETEQQRALAESNYKRAQRQQALAESSYKQAERQRALAEASYTQARRAVDELFVHFGDDVALNQPEFEPLRAELLQSALRYYQEFIDTWKDEPAKRAEIAASYRRVADLTQKIGAQPQAESAYQKALTLQQKLAEKEGSNKRIVDLARTWRMLGRSQQSAGKYADATHSYDESMRIYRGLAEKEPADAQYPDSIAVVLDEVGYLASERGELDQAIKYHEQSVEIHERLVKDQPENDPLRVRLAVSYANLGSRLTDSRRYDEALVVHNKRLLLLRQLVQQRGPQRIYEQEIGTALNYIGDVYRQNRQKPDWFEQALVAYQEARGIQERLLRDHPTSIADQSNLANTVLNTGQIYRFHKDHDDALAAFDESIVMLEKLVGTNPNGIYNLSPLGTAYAERARMLVALKRGDEAVAAYKKAIASHERLVGLAPSAGSYRRELDVYRQELERAQNKK
ncbi:MAG: serine/threonine-protein kinase [Planctomycetales bacterium]|nr:serine/threonine-protein kinase [Planctomycetales bacterium]